KFSDKWTSTEDKAAGMCPSEGDEAAIQAFLDACDSSVAVALAGGPLLLDPVTCDADLTFCTAALASSAISLGATVLTARVGGTGGDPYVRSCPSGEVAVGIDGTVGGFETPSIGNAQLVCAPFTNDKFGTGIGSTSLLQATGQGSQGGPFSLRCPATM